MGGGGATEPLIGRDAVVARALASVRDAHEGAGGVVTLVGAPGIGKTAVLGRILDEVEDVDEGDKGDDRIAVLRCVGVETEQQIAFAGLSDLVSDHLALADRLPAPQRAAVLAAVAQGPEAGGGNLAVASALLGVLRELAAERPVLVAIDDAQWLDAPSAAAVAFAARRIAGHRIAIVSTCRAEAVPAWLQPYPSIELPALDPAAAALVLDRVTTELSTGTRDAILRLAAGVPLALIELPADLDRDERLDPRGNAVLLRPAGRIGDLYSRRVASLDPTTRDALLVAALSAHEDLDTIAMAWRSIGRTAADVAEAERVRLVRVHDGALRFVHPLVRSALVHSATEGDRQRAHLALADVLGPDERGWHLAAARPGPSDEVAAALSDLAHAALARRAHLMACDAFDHAAQRTLDPTARLERRLAASDAAQRGGDLRRAVVVLDDPTLRDDDLDVPQRLRLAVTLGAACSQAGMLDRAREVLAGVADSPLAPRPQRALAAAFGSYVEFVAGRASAMVERAATAEQHLDDTAPPAVRGQALVAVARSSAVLEQADRREAALERLTEMLPELAVVASRLVPQVAFLLVQFGRVQPMLTRIPQLVGEAETNGEYNAVPFLLVAEATAAIEVGDWDRAEQQLDRSRAVSMETGLLNALGSALFLRAQLAALRGQVDLATRLLDGIDAAAGVVMVDTSARALAALAAGDLHTAADRFRTFWDHAANHRLTNWAPGRVTFGSEAVDVLLRVGDRSSAELIAAEIHRRADLGRDPLARAEAARVDGVLGGTDDADPSACFRSGLTHLEARPHAFARARLLLCLGEAERRAGRTAAARTILTEARAGFEALGARPWLERATTELRAAGARRRSSSTPVDALTDRERDVARAMAAGRSNPEIAAALFVSVKTIETHASKVLAKLGLRNRTELAAAVQRDPGLLADP